MTYSIHNNQAHISGKQGPYNELIPNKSVAYGRNAIYNYNSYINDLKLKPVHFPKLDNLAQLDEDKFELKMQELEQAIDKIDDCKVPIDFQVRYSKLKNGKIDTASLIAAGYEEMDGKLSVKTKELTKLLKKQFDTPSYLSQILDNIALFIKGKKVKPLQRPVRMSAKALDINKNGRIDLGEYSASIIVEDKLSTGKVDGVINNDGEKKLFAYTNKKNAKAACKILKQAHSTYNLEQAKRDFLSDSDNLESLS